MKKFFKKKSFNIIPFFNSRNLGSIPKIFLSSLIVIFSFYSLPILISFTNNKILNSGEFQNNSKAVLAYTLNQKNNSNINSNQKLDERDLLIDIYSLNEQETDTVRLDASTIKQLYEETDYKLDDIRKNKLVKPVALTLLPREIKMIEDTKKRKEFFIQIILPLILEENKNIRIDRKTLFNIIIFF